MSTMHSMAAMITDDMSTPNFEKIIAVKKMIWHQGKVERYTFDAEYCDGCLSSEEHYDMIHRSSNISAKLLRLVSESYLVKRAVWRASLPVAMVTGLDPEAIITGRRRAMEVLARRMTLWLTYECWDVSLIGMARAIGSNHSTVRHSINLVKKELESKGSTFYTLLESVMDAERELLISRS